jgi:hypothetical protein
MRLPAAALAGIVRASNLDFRIYEASETASSQ